jgi:hypothetical protein
VETGFPKRSSNMIGGAIDAATHASLGQIPLAHSAYEA